MRLASLASTALVLFSLAVHADTLDQQTSGTNPNAPGYFGQNFVINGTGSYTNITFNFYAYPSTTTPYAAGTGYLFSESYGGTPAGLSSATDNFLGSAPAANGVYTFAALVLPAGHNYVEPLFGQLQLTPQHVKKVGHGRREVGFGVLQNVCHASSSLPGELGRTRPRSSSQSFWSRSWSVHVRTVNAARSSLVASDVRTDKSALMYSPFGETSFLLLEEERARSVLAAA